MGWIAVILLIVLGHPLLAFLLGWSILMLE